MTVISIFVLCLWIFSKKGEIAPLQGHTAINLTRHAGKCAQRVTLLLRIFFRLRQSINQSDTWGGILIEILRTKTGLIPSFFTFPSCFCFLAKYGIFYPLSRFLPGLSNLSRFLPVLKRWLRSNFCLVLLKMVTDSPTPVTDSLTPVQKRLTLPVNRK